MTDTDTYWFRFTFGFASTDSLSVHLHFASTRNGDSSSPAQLCAPAFLAFVFTLSRPRSLLLPRHGNGRQLRRDGLSFHSTHSLRLRRLERSISTTPPPSCRHAFLRTYLLRLKRCRDSRRKVLLICFHCFLSSTSPKFLVY
ncbi:hypothetical protein P171DRAFT_261815 [Karstenula rhodostoma CBS 690.94]|uniref:Uncharacterized protein n=1 Tax=Karstenula rhodostoma CBS 690.94 TaxID=1392251 RepID=A0A9P4UDN8_9PLEO|nr:hypothetical protein P171DRAFT_261815 [Karstenula rhodostoma CBS 690.94]